MEAQSYTADLYAGFIGLRFLPDIFGIGHNNLNPKLVLHPATLEYRGDFFTNELAYSDVEKVSVLFVGSGTNNLTITPRTGLINFTGNFRSRNQLYQFLALLASKGCSLTPPAQQALAQHPQLGRW